MWAGNFMYIISKAAISFVEWCRWHIQKQICKQKLSNLAVSDNNVHAPSPSAAWQKGHGGVDETFCAMALMGLSPFLLSSCNLGFVPLCRKKKKKAKIPPLSSQISKLTFLLHILCLFIYLNYFVDHKENGWSRGEETIVWKISTVQWSLMMIAPKQEEKNKR